MELADLLDFERMLRQQDTTMETFLGYCLYLESRGVTSWEHQLSEEFGMNRETTSEALEWLEYLDVVARDSRGRVTVDARAGKGLHTRVKWLFNEHDIDQLEQATVEDPDDVNHILNVPDETDFHVDSTIIGSLVDLLAGTDWSAVVLNPFYTQVGFELIQEALRAVPKRGGTLTLVTRDVCQGTEENSNYVRQLISSLETADCTHRLTVFEFNKDQHETATFHVKAVIADRQRAYIGSANMTEGSLRNAIELGAVISGESVPPLAEAVDGMLASDLFVEVDHEEIQYRDGSG